MVPAQVNNEMSTWQTLGCMAQRGLVRVHTQGNVASVASVERHEGHPLIGSPVVVTSPGGTPLESMHFPSTLLSDPSLLVADVGEGLHLLQMGPHLQPSHCASGWTQAALHFCLTCMVCAKPSAIMLQTLALRASALQQLSCPLFNPACLFGLRFMLICSASQSC